MNHSMEGAFAYCTPFEVAPVRAAARRASALVSRSTSAFMTHVLLGPRRTEPQSRSEMDWGEIERLQPQGGSSEFMRGMRRRKCERLKSRGAARPGPSAGTTCPALEIRARRGPRAGGTSGTSSHNRSRLNGGSRRCGAASTRRGCDPACREGPERSTTRGAEANPCPPKSASRASTIAAAQSCRAAQRKLAGVLAGVTESSSFVRAVTSLPREHADRHRSNR